jgi:hypothetical protein
MNELAILKSDELENPLSVVDDMAASGSIDREMHFANVVGYGAGVKWKDGKPTGEPAVLALVTQKLQADLLVDEDIIPPTIDGVKTDVLAVGSLFAGDSFYRLDPMLVTRKLRPAKGGMSVGHYMITAGTIATLVYDILPGGSTNPPSSGIGIPSKYYILSNNHVLADSNAARIGDPILQPGPYDGGTINDKIGTLSRYIPIQFAPGVELDRQYNLVDAALAEVSFQDVERDIFSSGPVLGWARRNEVYVGQTVKKTGRTTNLTIGRITAIGAVIDVGYGNGRVARFRDQIVTTNMIAGGDSGSLVTDIQNRAVGLAYAGSPVAMIANQIENVRALLRVEISDSFLF